MIRIEHPFCLFGKTLMKFSLSTPGNIKTKIKGYKIKKDDGL
jgi:hypothetical protein